jgi:transcriptional regulator with XRE-family HTH domain
MKMEDVYKIIGGRMKSARKLLRLTQEKVAELADISLNFYGQIERNTKKASIVTLYRLSRVLHLDAGELWGDGKPNKRDVLVSEIASLAEKLSPAQRRKAIRVLKEIFSKN